MILCHMGMEIPLKFLPDMPTGPYNRVASNRLAKKLLGWEPRILFREGIRRTIDWYVKNRDPSQVRNHLQSMLSER
jgi:nucleoside-diphosphate-sugar epimerase